MADNELTPIRTDVGLAMHPESIAPHADVLGKNSLTGPAYRAADTALRRCYASAGAMKTAAAELKQGGEHRRGPGNSVITMIPDDRIKGFSDSAAHSFNKGSELHQSAMLEIDAAGKAVALGIDNALRDPRANEAPRTQVASEIRSHIKTLPPKDRQSFALQAVDEGDVEVVRALIQGGPFSSGMDRSQFALFRTEAEKKLAGGLVLAREHLNVMRDKLEQAGSTYLKTFLDTVPQPDARQEKRTAAVAKLREA